MDMHGKKGYRVLSKIIAIVIMQGIVLSGINSAYCGEYLRRKTGNLSPHINVGSVEVQQVFNVTMNVLADSGKLDQKISRRKFIRFSAIVATALVAAPSFAAKSMANTLTKEERERFEEIRNRLRPVQQPKKFRFHTG